ncbi:hypothetical protein ACF0H5_016849 [Mactra antiquata]
METHAIPVRVTNRNTDLVSDVVNQPPQKPNDVGFTVKSRRLVKRYCVLGLSNKLNVSALVDEVQDKGPKVTHVRVFPCRSDPSKVVVRLNIADDEYCECVRDSNFWPHYVSCRPWLNRGKQHARQPDDSPRYNRSGEWEVPPRMLASRIAHGSPSPSSYN